MAKSILQKKIIKALKEKRADLFRQIEYVNDALGLWDPPAPLLHRTAAEQNTEAVYNAIGHDWSSKGSLIKKTGLSSNAVTRATNRLLDDDKIITESFHNVVHYRRAVQELRLVAGEGVIKSRKARR